jgi:hypothetical protein
MGDRKQAIAALERALALDPDNALFKKNLDSLKSTPDPTPMPDAPDLSE